MCLEQDSDFSYGVFISKQLVERALPGVAIFKKDLDIRHSEHEQPNHSVQRLLARRVTANDSVIEFSQNINKAEYYMSRAPMCDYNCGFSRHKF